MYTLDAFALVGGFTSVSKTDIDSKNIVNRPFKGRTIQLGLHYITKRTLVPESSVTTTCKYKLEIVFYQKEEL